MPHYYGVDVSSNNGKPDWSKVKGISFAILRITEVYGIDTFFEHNFEGCKKAGIKIGGYRYSYANTAEESRREAEAVVSALAGRGLDFPIFLDLEWTKQESFGKKRLNAIIKAFRDVVVKSGYKFGIYCNDYWYKALIPDEAKKYDFWIAIVPNESKDKGFILENLRPSYGVGWQYSWNGYVAGFQTPVDMDVFYKDYSETISDTEIQNGETVGVTADDVLNLARSWLGRNEADGTHKMIIDVYNSHRPWARGYKVQYDDQWCDTFVSAVFIKLDGVYLIGGTECGVEEHIKIFKNAGIWIEDGSIVPNPGYLICYNWDDSTQPNDGFADHIGIVETCDGKTVTVIEGNYKDSVKRRTIPVGYGYIRGYAAPKYAEVSDVVPNNPPASDPVETGPSKTPKWVGRVTASSLNVRTWAGTENPNIKSWPRLNKGNLVDVCDTVNDSNGEPWYYIRIAGEYYGFVKSEYIEKV